MLFGIRRLDVVGFVLAASSAVYQGWSLQEFCWSIWLAGLCYSWACVATAGLQIVVTASLERTSYERRLPFLRQLSPGVFLGSVLLAVIVVTVVAFRLYTFLFGFYGLFLSVFAEIEPHSLFGRNGFINSDFFTPVTYLLQLFWPMVLGTLAAKGRNLFDREPWKRVALPFQSEVLRVHVLIVAMPFISLLAWFLFRGGYQLPTIILLMGLFYLMPGKPTSGNTFKFSRGEKGRTETA